MDRYEQPRDLWSLTLFDRSDHTMPQVSIDELRHDIRSSVSRIAAWASAA